MVLGAGVRIAGEGENSRTTESACTTSMEPRKWPGPCISCDVSASDQFMYSMGKFCKKSYRYFHCEGAKEIQSNYRK